MSFDRETTSVRVIEPGRGGILASVLECSLYRDLFYFLTLRDIRVRYKQTVLGVAWAVLQPLVSMLVFFLVFHRMAGISAGQNHYAIFALAGLVPWQLFRNSLERSSASVVSEARLLSKVYFPRLIIPLAAVGSALVDFAVAFGLLLVAIPLCGGELSIRILYVLPISLYAVVVALSVGLWLCALNVRFRDVKYVTPFLLQTWMFLSPVAYPSAGIRSLLPRELTWLYDLNPLVGIVDGFRWSILGGVAFPTVSLTLSAVIVSVLLVGGGIYFRSCERKIVDML